MLAKSTSSWIVGVILWCHLVFVSASIVVLWPTSSGFGVAQAWQSIAVEAFFIVLLCLIGVSTGRVGAGMGFGVADWIVHGVWTVAMIWSAITCVGPFCFRPQPLPGSLDGFGGGQIVMGLRLLILSFLYSGIPIGVALVKGRFQSDQTTKTSSWRAVSIGCFCVAVLTSAIIRRSWQGSEQAAGLIAGVLLLISFGLVAFLVVRGDNVATRILLVEAGLFGLFRLV